jgi:hypothetical protein
MAGKAKLLTPKEIGTLTEVLGNDRDRAIFAIGIYTGLRISEIISLKYNQVYTADGGVRNILKVKRRKKKNTVYSDIPMHTKLKKALDTYHNEAKAGGKDWLFPIERKCFRPPRPRPGPQYFEGRLRRNQHPGCLHAQHEALFRVPDYSEQPPSNSRDAYCCSVNRDRSRVLLGIISATPSLQVLEKCQKFVIWTETSTITFWHGDLGQYFFL